MLGDPPQPPPDPSGLPPGAARVMRAIGIALGMLFGSSEAEHEEHLVRGLARAAASTRVRPAASPVRPSSTASNRVTCS